MGIKIQIKIEKPHWKYAVPQAALGRIFGNLQDFPTENKYHIPSHHKEMF